ncbi:Polynucleotide 3'-phosphatase ZDP [Bienertia sinuspersici]
MLMVVPITTTISFFSLRLPLLTSPFTFSRKSLIKNPTLKPCFSNLYFNLQASSPLMASSSSIIAEYAKSNRSTCKTCSDSIAANTLRFGVVTRDKRKGIDMTKWHHFKCFSFDTHSLSSVDSIRGFDSLKSDDQEVVKKLVEEHDKVKDIDEDATAGDKQKKTKKKKTRDRVDVVNAEEGQVGPNKLQKRERDDESSPIKLELSVGEDAKVDIALAESDIKDIYKDASLLPKWKAFHTIIFLEKRILNGSVPSPRTGADAWSLMYPSIPGKLQKLYNDGYKLVVPFPVIYTNESNIDRWKNKRQKAVDSKLGRLNNFINLVKVPIQVYIACGFGPDDPYRKPKTGMWHVMEKHFNSGIPIDMEESFYVGDAAGRKNDHSDADIKFAQDIGLKFYYPEDFFT